MFTDGSCLLNATPNQHALASRTVHFAFLWCHPCRQPRRSTQTRHLRRRRLVCRRCPSAVRLADVEASRRPVSIVDGVVCDSAFRGWGYEHVVEVAGGYRLSAVPALRRLGLGQRVHVEIREAGCLVVCEPALAQVPLSDGDEVPISARFDHERLAQEASGSSAEMVSACGARVEVATARGSAGEDPMSGSCATDGTVTNGRVGARRFVRRSSVRGR